MKKNLEPSSIFYATVRYPWSIYFKFLIFLPHFVLQICLIPQANLSHIGECSVCGKQHFFKCIKELKSGSRFVNLFINWSFDPWLIYRPNSKHEIIEKNYSISFYSALSTGYNFKRSIYTVWGHTMHFSVSTLIS